MKLLKGSNAASVPAHGIRHKIFIPALILLIIFPIASWIIFGITSKKYMNATASRELNGLLTDIQKMTDHALTDSMGTYGEIEPERIKELLQDIRAYLKKKDNQTDMLIFSSKKKLVHPRPVNVTPDQRALSDYCINILENEKSSEIFLSNRQVSIGNTAYLVSLIEIPGSSQMRAKYLIAYIPIPDHTAMLAAVGRLVFLITAGLAGLSLFIVWMVARNLERPLQLLCFHMKTIGLKQFLPLQQKFSIREIDELRTAINDMTGRLEAAEQSQHTFFQNVSHELRTPLMSICGYAQGIQQGIFPDEKKAASVIAAESLRMKELVDFILTISKLDNGHVPLNLCGICFNDFIEEGLERLGGLGTVKDVSFHFQPPSDDIYVLADAGLLTKCFDNLTADCLQYAKSRITFTLTRQSETKTACLFIGDDGPGFSEFDLPHIFERFYKGEQGNFGIGLSLAKSCAEYMGGTICAKNSSSGAVFQITLPLTVLSEQDTG